MQNYLITKIKLVKRYLLALLVIIFSLKGFPQNTSSISLEERIYNSDLVILGEVIDSKSFWDINQKNIYTSYKIDVYKTIKGAEISQLEIVELGGIVDDIWQIVSPSIEFDNGDVGFFVLNNLGSNSEISNVCNARHKISGGRNGFWGVQDKEVFDLNSLPTSDKEIIDFFQRSFESLNQISGFKGKLQLKRTSAKHTITSISPTEATAGTGSLLNIYGTGFGSTQGNGQVWFSNSDYASAIYSSSCGDIMLWSDTHIKIVIPEKAATGNVTVKINNEDAVSSQVLKIKFSYTNSHCKPLVLINTDQLGGYTWRFNTNLNSNTSARSILKESIDEWICSTRVPWRIGETTSATSGMDGICSISFGSLDNGLGQASLWSQAIFTNSVNTEWVLLEVDITFKENVNYGYDRDNILSTQYDFKTVALHELAHAHLINHVKDNKDLMHFGITTNVIRDINSTNIECGNYIINKSLNFSNSNFQKIVLPAQISVGSAGLITGSKTVCAGQDAVTYSIPVIANATSYIWTLPPGAIGSSTTNSITVNYSSNAVSGNITIKGTNSCSTGASSSSPIIVNAKPSQPSAIAGATSVCQGSSQTYSVTNVAGVVYNWTFPSEWVKTAGGTTNSVTVTVGSGSGNISVTPSNGCGNGTARILSASITTAKPSQPSVIAGATSVCQGSSQTYSVTNVAGVVYNWTFPSEWVKTAGGTTNSVTVTVGSGSGNISVTPSNGCGNGTARILSASITTAKPFQPSAIAGATSVCQGSSQTYSVTNVAGVVYNWTFPSEWVKTAGGTTNSVTVTVGSGSGNISVTPSNGCGNGTAMILSASITTAKPFQPSAIAGATSVCQGSSQTYSVTNVAGVVYNWTFPSEWVKTAGGTTNSVTVTVGSGSGNISVTPSNGCGNGTARILSASITTAKPSQPSAIAGATSVCQGSSQTYSVTNVAGVVYNWTFPSEWVKTAGGTTNSVTVTVGSGSGNISVTPSNGCGNGTARILSASITTAKPSQPSVIAGATSVCQGSSQTYSVTNVAGVVYNWTFPSEWVKTAGGTTNSVTVTVGSGSGNISVTPSNGCGNGTARILSASITTAKPSQPSAIAGATSVCQGSSQTYSVTNVAGVVYNWTFPSEWVKTAGGTTNSVTVTVGSGSGNISVTPSNGCGNGTASFIYIVSNPIPPTPTINQNGNLLTSNSLTGNQWYNSLGIISEFTSQTIEAQSNESYYVMVSQNGCTSKPSNIISMIIDNVTFSKLENKIVIYPNPVTNHLFIEVEGGIIPINFSIVNYLGQTLIKSEVLNTVEINIKNLPNNIYFIRFEVEGQTISKRFIKKQ
jgi:hypothetical protein